MCISTGKVVVKSKVARKSADRLGYDRERCRRRAKN